jgi:hypothetical protein
MSVCGGFCECPAGRDDEGVDRRDGVVDSRQFVSREQDVRVVDVQVEVAGQQLAAKGGGLRARRIGQQRRRTAGRSELHQLRLDRDVVQRQKDVVIARRQPLGLPHGWHASSCVYNRRHDPQ